MLSVIAISFVTFFVIKAQEEKTALENRKTEIYDKVQAYGRDYLDLSKGTSIKKDANFDNFTKALTLIYDFKTVTVYDTAGTVIFSENPAELNQNLLTDPNVKNAVGGTIGIQKEKGSTKAKLYIPLTRSDNTARAVVSGTVDLGYLLKSYDKFLYLTIATSTVMSALVILVSYLLFQNAEESVTQKDRLLMDQSKALEEEQQQDEAVLSSIAESLVVINKDGQIVYFNPEAERITGFNLSDVEFRLYKNFLNFTDKDGKEQKQNPITEALKSGAKIQINIKNSYFIKQNKGTLIPVSISVAPILSKDKEIRGVAATIQDITTEKELDKVKDEFVYVVAHELGNPIFALDGYLSILETQLEKSDKKNREVLSMAQGVKQQLSELVNDLLEVVRNEQGTLKYELAPISLTDLTNEVVRNAQFKAKTKDIKLNYTETKIPKAIGQEQKIKEVLTNFVDNAIKYTPNGGKVNVSQEVTADGIVTHVQDNGFGISKIEQEHLFEKFFRIKTAKTASISGTGLGLFICKEIVEKCGGKVWAESEEGKGSTFSFSLKPAK